jgi:hypothetical protein
VLWILLTLQLCQSRSIGESTIYSIGAIRLGMPISWALTRSKTQYQWEVSLSRISVNRNRQVDNQMLMVWQTNRMELVAHKHVIYGHSFHLLEPSHSASIT